MPKYKLFFTIVMVCVTDVAVLALIMRRPINKFWKVLCVSYEMYTVLITQYYEGF